MKNSSGDTSQKKERRRAKWASYYYHHHPCWVARISSFFFVENTFVFWKLEKTINSDYFTHTFFKKNLFLLNFAPLIQGEREEGWRERGKEEEIKPKNQDKCSRKARTRRRHRNSPLFPFFLGRENGLKARKGFPDSFPPEAFLSTQGRGEMRAEKDDLTMVSRIFTGSKNRSMRHALSILQVLNTIKWYDLFFQKHNCFNYLNKKNFLPYGNFLLFKGNFFIWSSFAHETLTALVQESQIRA